MFRCCCCRHYTEGGRLLQVYIHYSLGHSKAQQLPGLHPRKPLNRINKTVIKFRCNSLTSDCPEKFILILQRCICNQFSCSEGRQDALWSCRYCRARRERRHNYPQLLKPSLSANSSSFHCHRDNKRVSQHTLLWNTSLTFSPFQTFSVTLCHSWLLTAHPQLHVPASSSTSFAPQNSHQKNTREEIRGTERAPGTARRERPRLAGKRWHRGRQRCTCLKCH